VAKPVPKIKTGGRDEVLVLHGEGDSRGQPGLSRFFSLGFSGVAGKVESRGRETQKKT
jgi:hypothetical protein